MFYLLHSGAPVKEASYGIQDEDASVKLAGEQRIYREEFMKIFEVYELWKYESKFSVFFNDTADAVEQTPPSASQIFEELDK